MPVLGGGGDVDGWRTIFSAHGRLCSDEPCMRPGGCMQNPYGLKYPITVLRILGLFTWRLGTRPLRRR